MLFSFFTKNKKSEELTLNEKKALRGFTFNEKIALLDEILDAPYNNISIETLETLKERLNSCKKVVLIGNTEQVKINFNRKD